MAQNPVVEKLVQNAVGRCRERAIRAQRRVEGALSAARMSPDQAGPGSFTAALKRSRGL